MLLKIKILVIAFLIVHASQGQYLISNVTDINNKANSPYSLFGLGDLNTGGFSPNKGMGDAGIALINKNTINILNPASYGQQDTLAFIFDVGYATNISNLNSESESFRTAFANIDHLAIGFTVTKWWGASLGIMPYSRTGYNIRKRPAVSGSYETIIQTGSGELNKFYLGNAFDLTHNLSVGANVNYLFGKKIALTSAFVSDSSGLYIDPLSQSYFEKSESLSKGFLFDLGFIYGISAGNMNMNLGFTFQPKTELSSNLYKSDSVTLPNNIGNTNRVHFDTSEVKTSIPAKIGVGISLEYDQKLTLSADYKIQNWTDMTIDGNVDRNLTKSEHFNVGLQFIPTIKTSGKYIERIKYRAGGYYYKTPIMVNNQHVTDKGLTLGIGLPFKTTSTQFNISCQAGMRGMVSSELIEEKYIKLNLNVSFFDFWFYKPKFD